MDTQKTKVKLKSQVGNGKKEIVVTEGLEVHFTAKIICEKCGHNEASWVIRQARAADEPSTRIYQCTNPSVNINGKY